MKPRFFRTPADFRKWFEKNHATVKELMVGFYKKGSGQPSITWPESVDQALCFGWIDGIRRNIDDISYTIRFTPRRPTSTWSAINIRRVTELSEQGLMRPAGLKAFELRREDKSGIYAYEQKETKPELDQKYEKKLKKNSAAWEFFQKQPASYRQRAAWWVMSGKSEETRLRRIEKLISESARGNRL